MLAQLLLKTTDNQTKLSENPALLSIVQSLCNTSELYFSRTTPLQWNPDVNVHSRAISDRSGSTCDSSLSLPSSVHVADVTHDKCAAYEHPACHGVSGTANETNVNCNIILDETEGMSFGSLSSSSTISRKKRAATMIDKDIPSAKPTKRVMPEHKDTPKGMEPITSVLALEDYLLDSGDMKRKS